MFFCFFFFIECVLKGFGSSPPRFVVHSFGALPLTLAACVFAAGPFAVHWTSGFGCLVPKNTPTEISLVSGLVDFPRFTALGVYWPLVGFTLWYCGAWIDFLLLALYLHCIVF